MCNKGSWVAQCNSEKEVSGFFRIIHGNQYQGSCLSDTSGIIPVAMSNEFRLRNFANRIIWASGRIEDSNGNHMIRLWSAVPVTCWTGNPFAIVRPDLPGFSTAQKMYKHVQSIRDKDLRSLIKRRITKLCG